MSINIRSVHYPHPTEEFTMRAPVAITDFVIHHSAGPLDQLPLDIDAFERTRGDIFIPYTWLIRYDGTIYSGRPPLAISAASFGRNTESVAVCMIGNFESRDPGFTGEPSEKAMAALLELCTYAHRAFAAITRTYAHGDIARMFYDGDDNYSTECCGDRLRVRIPLLKSKVYASMQHGRSAAA